MYFLTTNTRENIRLIGNFIENRLLSETQYGFVLQKADSATFLKFLFSLSQGVGKYKQSKYSKY